MSQQVVTCDGQPRGGRSVGRGRATGPSFARGAFAGAAVALALAVWFTLTTAAVRVLAPSAVAVAVAGGAGIGLLTWAGGGRAVAFSRRDATGAFCLGAAALALAPLIVASNRYSDAPSGSEVLFLITAGWGVLLTAASLRAGGPAGIRIAGAVIAAAGVAGIVANWERPSSFSLFVRYRAEEAAILGAGILWTALWARLELARLEGRFAPTVVSTAAGGLAAAAALGISRLGTATIGHAVSQPLWWLIVASSAALAACASHALHHGGIRLLAGSWFTPAIAVTAFTAIEQAFMPLGIQPILLGPAAAGALATLAGVALVAGTARAHPHHALLRVPSPVAAVSLVASLAALVLPALEASVVATRADGSRLQASFTLLGLETVGGWLALGLAAAALALTRAHDRRPSVWMPVAAGLVAWPFVWQTPLHTLSSAIPWEVQVDYGSEFATIVFQARPVPAMLVAVGGATLAVALLLVRRSTSRPRGEDS